MAVARVSSEVQRDGKLVHTSDRSYDLDDLDPIAAPMVHLNCTKQNDPIDY